MKKRLARILTIILTLVLIGNIYPGFADAARVSQLTVENKGDFVLEPGKIEVFLNPGEKAVRTISVINRINRSVTFKVEKEDFIGSDQVNAPVVLLGEDKSPYSFKDNLIPESDEFTLSFGQKMELPISIEVPDNAAPGGYYSSVIISSLPTESKSGDQAGAKVISRAGALFFVRVNGPVEHDAKLEDFRVAQSNFLKKGPVNFEILFKNSGSVHLVPHGQVTIKNMFGQQIAQLPVDAYFALPKSLRYREVVWEKERLFGRYTAELKLDRGYEGKEDIAKVSFWAIPWGVILTIFGSFLLIFIVWKFVLSRFEFRRKS